MKTSIAAALICALGLSLLAPARAVAGDRKDQRDKKKGDDETAPADDQTSAKAPPPARVAEASAFPADPVGVAEKTAGERPPEAAHGPAVALNDDTWLELHGYARMPVAVQTTPRQPFLVDNDYYLSGFAYTRLYEPDWSEIFLSAHHGDYRVQFGIFASLYSDYATTELEKQFGVAQASVAADHFLGFEPLSVEAGVFWDRFGYIEPYDTYIFGRTHQGGVKARWKFGNGAYLQAGIGAHQEQLQQNQGLTPVAHLAGGLRATPDLLLGGYLIKAWTRDKRQLSPIQDGDLLVAGVDARWTLPRGLGSAYGALSYTKADSALFLAPALELLHSTGGRGLTENYLGLMSSENGTGSLLTFAVDAPMQLGRGFDLRVFGMTTWVRSKQADSMDPAVNKDRRLYLKWGAEPGYVISKRRGVRAALRYDRVIMDLYDAENSFRGISPELAFPLQDWGELMLMYTHYSYGAKITLRPGQVPLETKPDTDVFKVQAQAVW